MEVYRVGTAVATLTLWPKTREERRWGWLALPKIFHRAEIGLSGLGLLKKLICLCVLCIEHGSGVRTETVTIRSERLFAHGYIVEAAEVFLQLL